VSTMLRERGVAFCSLVCIIVEAFAELQPFSLPVNRRNHAARQKNRTQRNACNTMVAMTIVTDDLFR